MISYLRAGHARHAPGFTDAVNKFARPLPGGDAYHGFAIAAAVRAAQFAGGFDLFVGAYVGLRGSNFFLSARYLALMPLRESFIHTLA